MIIEIAKVKIKINNNYEYLNNLCKDYIIDSDDFDFEVTINQNDLDEEKKKCTETFQDGYLESLCCYRKICLQLPSYNAFLIHAAIVKVDNYAYAFSAKSGTGKTTHTRLWKKLLGDKMSYINGDKPIIRIIDNIPYAFGTPWCGKEQYGSNTFAPLKALCFIERNPTNEIIDLPKKDVLLKIIHQILIPTDEINASKTFELLNDTITLINTYVLKCNMELEAAVVSFNKMSE